MDPKRSAPPSEDQFLDQMSRQLAGWSDPLERLNQALQRDELQLFCQPVLRLRPPRQFVMAEVLESQLRRRSDDMQEVAQLGRILQAVRVESDSARRVSEASRCF